MSIGSSTGKEILPDPAYLLIQTRINPLKSDPFQDSRGSMKPVADKTDFGDIE
jgi:hypothetical protein